MKSFEVFCIYNNNYDAFWPGLWDGQKWILIGRFALRAWVDFNWGGLWLLVLAVLIGRRALRIREDIGFLVQFIIFYIILYFLIYTVSVFKLEWLLSVAFDRLLYLLAPTVAFVIFYVIGQKKQV